MMRSLTIVLGCLGLLVAGLMGISLSVPLQAPAVILLGITAVLSSVSLMKSRQVGGRPRWVIGLAMTATVYFIVRAGLSPVRDLGVEDLMLILPAAGLYLVAGYGAGSIQMRQALAWIVVLLLFLHLGAAFIQLAGGDGYSLSMLLTSTTRASEGVVTGMYGYRGSFANFAVIAGMLCLSLAAWGRMGLYARGAMGFLGCITLVFVILSGSRSAVLSLVAAMAVFGVAIYLSVDKLRGSTRGRVRTLVVVMVTMSLFLGIVGGVRVFQDRANNVSGSEIAFDSGVRLAFWPMAIEQWQDHPMVGAGSRSYSYECFRYWSPNLDSGEHNPEFVHNEYLQLLADYGIIGFLCVTALIVGHFVIGVKRVKKLASKVGENGMKQGANAMALTIAGLCGMTGMAVHIIFDFRTHLLANLLLLVCCAVWVIPLRKRREMENEKSKIGGGLVGCFVLILGVFSSYLGITQLWGSWPLLENRIAKEDGGWDPYKVERAKWIPLLETSVQRAPHFRRHQRLGTLYMLEAIDNGGDERERILDLAKHHFQLAGERHPQDIVSRINLAKIETDRGHYADADTVFASVSEVAASRERWVRMHSVWAKMHQRWAVDLWSKGEIEGAENHFQRARELFKASYGNANFRLNKQWGVEYTILLITHARFLDEQKKFEMAEPLFKEGMEQVDWVNWQTDTKLNFYYAQHLFGKGWEVWHRRDTKKAYQLMKRAKASMLNVRGILKGDVDKSWEEQMKKIEDVMGFLEAAGEGRK